MVRTRCSLATLLLFLASILACRPGADPRGPEPAASLAATAASLVVGGYECVSSGTCADRSFSEIPEDGEYYLTTFDGETMACGKTADGTWAYIAGKARWGCGARVLVTNPANGRSCVTEAADCGPNRCVEQAAKKPVVDASPLVSQYLLGQSQAGWSEKKLVIAQEVGADSLVGCPGVVVGEGPDAGPGDVTDAADAGGGADVPPADPGDAGGTAEAWPGDGANPDVAAGDAVDPGTESGDPAPWGWRDAVAGDDLAEDGDGSGCAACRAPAAAGGALAWIGAGLAVVWVTRRRGCRQAVDR